MSWRVMAACRGANPAIFFSELPLDVVKAKQCCAGCPVSQPCREHARSAGEYGTWGGELDSERPTVARQRVSH